MEPINTYNIDNGSIKILGSQIRRKRKQLAISQSELAEGICTQGLISQIENKNVSPSIDTIYKICERLDLSVHDVITKGKTKNKTLDKVESAIWNRQYVNANQLIQQINVTNLANRELKCRYYCYLGDIQYKLNLDYEAAIKNFNEVLIKYSGINKQNLYTTWAHIGIAKAYLMLKNQNQANQFNELARAYLELHQFSLRKNFKLLVNIYVEAINLHHELLKYDEAMLLSTVACQFLLSVDSMYQLGALNLAMARSLIASNAHQKAISYLDRAHHFGDVNDDSHIVDQVHQLRNQVIK